MNFFTRVSSATAFVCMLGLLLAVGPVDLRAQSSSAAVGEQAPDFTLEAANGETYTLSDLEGEYVILEWLNFGCPYVSKHYGSGNMQRLQEKYTEQGVNWFSVVSSAPGTQGYYPADEMIAQNQERNGQQTAVLLDPTGKVGMKYGAKVTPHMYIINPEGELIYMGGIDDKPTTDEADIETATNFVEQAMSQAMTGEKVTRKTAPPYGCTVKYASR